VDYHGYDWQPLPGAEERINAEIAPCIVAVSEDELPRQEPIVVLDRIDLTVGCARRVPPDAASSCWPEVG
jgi:hypothetical protein